MKVAICFSGGLRCFKETYPYTKKYILSKLDCDIFFYGAENVEGKEQNYKDFLSLYRPKDFVINDNNFYTEIVNALPLNWDKKINVCSMYYNIYMCNELRKKTNIQYDIIIRSRTDCFYKSSIPQIDFEYALNNKLIVPGCWGFEGVTDLFAIANPSIYDKYADTFLHLTEYLNKNIIHPETIMKVNCERHNLDIHYIDKYMEFEFPDTLDASQENHTFTNASSRNFKYSYDKK